MAGIRIRNNGLKHFPQSFKRDNLFRSKRKTITLKMPTIRKLGNYMNFHTYGRRGGRLQPKQWPDF